MKEPYAPGGPFLRAILDAIPLPIFVVDDDMEILEYNGAGREMIDGSGESFLRVRGGEALRCIHSKQSPGGCGRSAGCEGCVLRGSVREAGEGRRVVRRKARMELVQGRSTRPLHLLVTAAPVEYGGRTCFLLVLEDIRELMELKSILPMCASCHKIRDDRDYWSSVETYFKHHLDVDFSHGLCPDCVEKLYPEFRGTGEPST